MNEMDKAATEWVQTRQIIAEFLKELRPDLTDAEHEHNAAAIIARLAHASFLIEKASE